MLEDSALYTVWDTLDPIGSVGYAMPTALYPQSFVPQVVHSEAEDEHDRDMRDARPHFDAI